MIDTLSYSHGLPLEGTNENYRHKIQNEYEEKSIHKISMQTLKNSYSATKEKKINARILNDEPLISENDCLEKIDKRTKKIEEEINLIEREFEEINRVLSRHSSLNNIERTENSETETCEENSSEKEENYSFFSLFQKVSTIALWIFSFLIPPSKFLSELTRKTFPINA